MRQGFVGSLLVLLAASYAMAEQVVVFKKDGRYGERMITVESIETDRHGRLLLHADGELFVVERSEVDWTLSQVATLRHQVEQRALAEKRTEADAERRTAFERAQASAELLTLVQASRRFGVERPALTVASGSAARSIAAPRSAGGDAAAATAASADVPDTPQMKRSKDRITAIHTQQKKLATDIAALKADTNPDPVAAGIRASQIERKERQIEALRKRLAEAEAQLATATEEAGEQAAAAAAAAAAGANSQR